MGRAFEVRKASMAKTSAAKSKVYSKFGKELFMKAKGNPDPELNLDLKSCIDRAKRAQVPKHVIDKAIDKAKGGSGEDLKEKIFEGFGPGKSTLLVKTLSDNDNRTASDVRNCFTKTESRIAVQNAVSFQYAHKAVASFKTTKSEDELLEEFIMNEVDIEEVELADGIAEATGEINILQSLEKCVKTLVTEDEDILVCENMWIPSEEVTLEGDNLKRFNKLIEMLEELEDVQDVIHNVKL